jgi:hypothetical protein
MEYQPQIRVRNLNKDADGLDPGREARMARTLNGTLNAGRFDPG